MRVWGFGGGLGGLGRGFGEDCEGRLARVSGLGFRVYAVFPVYNYCRVYSLNLSSFLINVYWLARV